MTEENKPSSALARVPPKQIAGAIPNEHLSTQMDVFKIGDVLARSGFFNDTREAAQAVVKVLAGAEMGFPPVASMMGIHIIKGKVTLSANLMAAAIKRKGSQYNYRVTRLDNKGCEIKFFENGDEVGVASFTEEDAKAAKVFGNDVWNKYPKNMYFARALSNGARWYCPNIFGGSAVYTPEELGEAVTGEGELIVSPAPTTNTQTTSASESAEQQRSAAEAMREQHGQAIAAAGLVTRSGDRFNVSTTITGGAKKTYEVWRDDTGKVRCRCLEFEEGVSADPSFRCEHIIAVKHSLVAKNTEAVTKQNPPTDDPELRKDLEAQAQLTALYTEAEWTGAAFSDWLANEYHGMSITELSAEQAGEVIEMFKRAVTTAAF